MKHVFLIWMEYLARSTFGSGGIARRDALLPTSSNSKKVGLSSYYTAVSDLHILQQPSKKKPQKQLKQGRLGIWVRSDMLK